MDRVSPAGPIYQAGTLSGNPLAMVAGLWSLKRLNRAALSNAGALGHALAAGLADAARDAGVPLQVNALGSMVTPFFTRRARARLPHGGHRRHRGVRRVLPRDARARNLPAAVAVRSVVHLRQRTRARDIEKTIAAARERDDRSIGRRARSRIGHA